MKTCAVIVTYNRKELLLRCIGAVVEQSVKPELVLIVDNCSTDGTEQYLVCHNVLNELKSFKGISIEYHRLPINGGGSMGFYYGLKTAYEKQKFGVFWVMDDDGLPEEKCLSELLCHLHLGEYLSPMVIDIEDHTRMAFGNDLIVADYVSQKAINNDYIPKVANPFNGILYTRKFIEVVGLPEKDMFIWGDEINYDLRARQHGFEPNVVVDAVHYHPRNRASLSPSFAFGRKVIFVDSKWKMYCRCCNAVYNYKLSGRWIKIIKEFLLYNYFFGIIKHSFSWLKLYNKAFFYGLCSKFGGHNQYMTN